MIEPGSVLQYNIHPVPKPRMTQADRWKKRPCILRYFDYKDKCRELGITVENGDHIIFVMPMAKSWSKKKREESCRKPHLQKPDVDNLAKGLMDAILEEDCEIYDIRITKIWGDTAEIIIKKGVYEWNQ